MRKLLLAIAASVCFGGVSAMAAPVPGTVARHTPDIPSIGGIGPFAATPPASAQQFKESRIVVANSRPRYDKAEKKSDKKKYEKTAKRGHDDYGRRGKDRDRRDSHHDRDHHKHVERHHHHHKHCDEFHMSKNRRCEAHNRWHRGDWRDDWHDARARY